MRLLHLLTGSLGHSSWANCSSCLRFDGCLLQTASFSSFHRMFDKIQIRTHRRPLQNNPMFCCYPFLGAFSCVFWVIILLEDPWPATETELSDTGQYVSLQNTLIVLRFHCALHRFKAPCARCSKAAPNHNQASSIFHCRYDVIFFESFIFSYVNIWCDLSKSSSFLTHHYSGFIQHYP